MSKPAFRPWVGPSYAEGLNGIKLLVLGEAQYSGDCKLKEPLRPLPSDVDQTEQIVRNLAIDGPEPHRPFWTKVTKLLLNRSNGEPVSSAERADIWNRLVFYNYIQWWMPSGRTRPTQAMWDEAREPFLSVLSEHSPDAILVLGKRLRKNLPLVSTRLICIPHPSSRGFTYGRWCGEIFAALGEARTQ